MVEANAEVALAVVEQNKDKDEVTDEDISSAIEDTEEVRLGTRRVPPLPQTFEFFFVRGHQFISFCSHPLFLFHAAP